MDETREGLRYLFQTTAPIVCCVSGTGNTDLHKRETLYHIQIEDCLRLIICRQKPRTINLYTKNTHETVTRVVMKIIEFYYIFSYQVVNKFDLS